MGNLTDNEWVRSGGLLLAGALIKQLFDLAKNRTATVIYRVRTEHVGLSAQDELFGNVQVSWRDSHVNNLYMTTIDIENVSLADFKAIAFKVYSGNGVMLLSQFPRIVDSTYVLSWTADYAQRIHVAAGQVPTQEQWNLYNTSREYECPVLNRGQKVQVQILSTNMSANVPPPIYVDCLHERVQLKYRAHQAAFLGIPVSTTLPMGILISLVTFILTSYYLSYVWLAGLLCLLVGLFAQLIAALVYKGYLKLRGLVLG